MSQVLVDAKAEQRRVVASRFLMVQDGGLIDAGHELGHFIQQLHKLRLFGSGEPGRELGRDVHEAASYPHRRTDRSESLVAGSDNADSQRSTTQQMLLALSRSDTCRTAQFSSGSGAIIASSRS